jgi:hypothetical protein
MKIMQQKYRNMGWAIVLLMVWSAAIFWISDRSDSDWGHGFALYSWVELTRWVCLGAAGLLFLLRVFRLVDQDRNFLYCCFAMVNAAIGLTGIVLYPFENWNVTAMHEFLLNLLVGVVMLADVLFFSGLFMKPDK